MSEVSQGRKGSGWDLPVGAAPTNLVLQAPPWSEVQQRGPQHSPVTHWALQALHNRRRDQPRDYSSNTGIFPPRSVLLSPISKSLSFDTFVLQLLKREHILSTNVGLQQRNCTVVYLALCCNDDLLQKRLLMLS